MVVNIAYFLLAAPRILATGWASASRLIDDMTGTDAAHTAWSAVQLLLLLLPALGLAYTLVRTVRRGAVGAWLGVRIFRHKSSKKAFLLPLIIATIVGALAWYTILDLFWQPQASA